MLAASVLVPPAVMSKTAGGVMTAAAQGSPKSQVFSMGRAEATVSHAGGTSETWI